MFNKILVIAFAVIATIFMCANMAKAQVVTEGLVSYWSFDAADIDGNTAKDVFGENNGTMEGGPEVVEGRIRQALEFDSTNYVDLGAPESLNMDPPLTVSMWVNRLGSTPAGCIWLGNNLDPDQVHGWTKNLIVINAAGTLSLDQYPPSGGSCSTEVGLLAALDVWHYITAVLDVATAYLYVDGSLEAECSLEVYGGPDPTNWLIGGRIFPENDGTYKFNGLVDEVCVYNRALSEDEIDQNMNASGITPVRPADKLALTWGDVKLSR